MAIYKLRFLIALLALCASISAVMGAVGQPKLMWHSAQKQAQDQHYAFRGCFNVDSDEQIELQFCGATQYVIWLDGSYFYEGPDRYNAKYPQYQSKSITLSKGSHQLAIQVHYDGLSTRILRDIEPFLYCQAIGSKGPIQIGWKCEKLNGYQESAYRVSKQFGWVEWVDTAERQAEWQKSEYDDSAWGEPVSVQREIGELTKSEIANVKAIKIKANTLAEGRLAEMYGYERDNPSARFFLRDLGCKTIRPQGVWRRYDLGRVKLVRPKFILDLPKGAVVEFAYSEALNMGRVVPWMTLSLGDSYNMDHFVARGGVQEFSPLNVKGGRFVEIHVIATTDKIKFIDETFIERTYYDSQQGSFTSNDTLINKIWQTGIDTYRSCSEDAVTDNPTRERGEWLGDVGIGMLTGRAGFSDIAICRRGLVHFAQCAREDGMVAGLCPGLEEYLSTYAAQWVTACMKYWECTGDRTILEELYPNAQRNIAAFEKHMTEEGISAQAGWGFVDWGYVPNSGPTDMGLNLHVYRAIKDMERWSKALQKENDAAEYAVISNRLGTMLSRYYDACKINGDYDWDKIGYHRTVLGIANGFVPRENIDQAVVFIKNHIMNCFPNNPDAPLLSDPGANNPQLITPYFAHHVFPILIENGQMDFVLEQYRTCWGWMLGEGRSTWMEVFDTRWSHCHQWSGCPTWQLSRYALGLQTRFDIKKNHYVLELHTGNLKCAKGRIPLSEGKYIDVQWEKKANKIEYCIWTNEPISVDIPKVSKATKSGRVNISAFRQTNIDITVIPTGTKD